MEAIAPSMRICPGPARQRSPTGRRSIFNYQTRTSVPTSEARLPNMLKPPVTCGSKHRHQCRVFELSTRQKIVPRTKEGPHSPSPRMYRPEQVDGNHCEARAPRHFNGCKSYAKKIAQHGYSSHVGTTQNRDHRNTWWSR